jgi:hypothetical protein
LIESFAPSGFSLFAYKFGTDNQGNPVFTQAGKSALTFAGKTIPTITTLNGQPGTAIVSGFCARISAFTNVPLGLDG